MNQPSRPPEHDHRAAPPDLAAAAGGWAEGELTAVLPADQGRRWRAGERVLVEDYLRLVPALRSHPLPACGERVGVRGLLRLSWWHAPLTRRASRVDLSP